MNRLLSIIFVCLFTIAVQAYSTEKLQIETPVLLDQAELRVVNDICKDADGFVWFATYRKLHRYDGLTLKSYSSVLNDTTTLTSSIIFDLEISPIDSTMWVATNNGLNVYDSEFESFRRVRSKFDKEELLTKSQIRTLYFSPDKTSLWLGTFEGLVMYDMKNDVVQRFVLDEFNTLNNEVRVIVDDHRGSLWLGTYDGLYRFSLYSKKIERVPFEQYFEGDPRNMNISALMFDKQNDDILYIGTHGGLYVYDVEQKKNAKILRDDVLTHNQIKAICPYGSQILIGTERGINILNTITFQTEAYTENLLKSNPIICDYISKFYEDDSNLIWVATRDGAFIIDKNYSTHKEYFVTYEHKSVERYADLSCVTSAKDGSLWFGSSYGVFNVNESTGVKRHFTPRNSKLSRDITTNVHVDKNGILWCGGINGLQYFQDETFYNAIPPHDLEAELKYIYAIKETKNGDIVVNYNEGLCVITPTLKNGKIVDLKYKSVCFSSVIGKYNIDITNFEVFPDGTLWVANENSIYCFDNKYNEVYKHPYSSLIKNNISQLMVNSKNELIVAANGEIINCTTNRSYNSPNIPTSVTDLIEDVYGNYWIAGYNTIAKLDVNSGKVLLLKPSNIRGIKKGFLGSRGRMYFSGISGYISFNPIEINIDMDEQQCSFTSLSVLGTDIVPNKSYDGNVILTKSITRTDAIVLNHKQNSIQLTFSQFDYSKVENSQYRYKLEGYDQNWTTLKGKLNHAVYNQLPPGKYVLKLQDAAFNGQPQKTRELKIRVKTAWWKSIFALICYQLIALALLYYLYCVVRDKNKLSRELYKSGLEKEKNKEIATLKQRLLANVTHDLRTPLTLILTPLEGLLAKATDKKEKNTLLVMAQNGQYLSSLIDQIIDIKNIDTSTLKTKLSTEDIVSFTSMVCSYYSEQAIAMGIDYNFNSNVKLFYTQFDADKLEKAFQNILSNAFKYTQTGRIDVSVNVNEAVDGKSLVEFTFKDTGIGISKEDLELIFVRFFRCENGTSLNKSGSGIGLELTKEYIELHGGEIKVDSELGVGTTITVQIEFEQELNSEIELLSTQDSQPELLQRILVVEDNKDLCDYITSELSEKYEVFKANTAESALKVVAAHHINVVVTDLMLPKMSGYELCANLKSSSLTSSIPIIMLTAKGDNESKTAGYEAGVDAYITKPFSMKMLLTRIEQILNKQKELHDNYINNILSQSTTQADANAENDKFINKLISIVMENIDNSEVNIPQICKMTGYSHQQVYLKVKQITGQTIVEFVKTIRMKKAAQLMRENNNLSISEVMYEVGIDSLSYFSKCFSKYFGMSPKQYKQQIMNESTKAADENKENK